MIDKNILIAQYSARLNFAQTKHSNTINQIKAIISMVESGDATSVTLTELKTCADNLYWTGKDIDDIEYLLRELKQLDGGTNVKEIN